jgi:hypothetical protein
MRCSTCVNLERALKSRHREYLAAQSAVLLRVRSELAAYDFVEMERARSELDMHRSICSSAIAAAALQHSLVPEPVLSEV